MSISPGWEQKKKGHLIVSLPKLVGVCHSPSAFHYYSLFICVCVCVFFFAALFFVFVAGIVGGAILLPCINCNAKRQRRINFSYLISPELQMEAETRTFGAAKKKQQKLGGSLMHSVACLLVTPLRPFCSHAPERIRLH